MGCQVVNIYGGHKRMKILFCVQSDIFWHQNPLVMVVVQFQFGRALSRWSALKCGLALRRDSMQIVFRGSAFIVSNINNFQIKCSLPWVCFFVLSSCSVSLVKCIITLLKSTCFFPWRMSPCTERFCRLLQLSYPFHSAQGRSSRKGLLGAVAEEWAHPSGCTEAPGPRWAPWTCGGTIFCLVPGKLCLTTHQHLSRSARPSPNLWGSSKGSLRDDVIACIMLKCQALEAFSAAPAAQPCILTWVKWHCLGGSWVNEACTCGRQKLPYTALCAFGSKKKKFKNQQNSQEGSGEGEIITEKGI